MLDFIYSSYLLIMQYPDSQIKTDYNTIIVLCNRFIIHFKNQILFDQFRHRRPIINNEHTKYYKQKWNHKDDVRGNKNEVMKTTKELLEYWINSKINKKKATGNYKKGLHCCRYLFNYSISYSYRKHLISPCNKSYLLYTLYYYVHFNLIF